MRAVATIAFVFLSTLLMQVAVYAQTPTPSPATQAGVSPSTQIESLSSTAKEFVPAIKRIIEGQLLRRYALLATVVAQLVMMASLVKLLSEKPGPTRDFFGFVFRAIIILPLIL